jgi:hypothetical protein
LREDFRNDGGKISYSIPQRKNINAPYLNHFWLVSINRILKSPQGNLEMERG